MDDFGRFGAAYGIATGITTVFALGVFFYPMIRATALGKKIQKQGLRKLRR